MILWAAKIRLLLCKMAFFEGVFFVPLGSFYPEFLVTAAPYDERSKE
jgi:hypothetical protein